MRKRTEEQKELKTRRTGREIRQIQEDQKGAGSRSMEREGGVANKRDHEEMEMEMSWGDEEEVGKKRRR